MILFNGTIEIRDCELLSNLDVNGYPDTDAPAAGWLEAVPCLIVQSNLNYLAKSQNENAYVDASYTVLIEIDSVEAREALIEGGKVKLNSSLQGDLGEFSVIRVELLDVVGVIKIVV
jgi:hypothetical protein